VTACDRVRTGAPGLAALPPDDPERAAAWAHARGCSACARALREAERLQALVGEEWRPAPVTAAALERASGAIRADLRRDARRRAAASVAAAAAAAVALAGIARERSPSPADWVLAAVLLALALVLAAAAGRKPGIATGVAAGGAAVAAALTGHAGPLAAAVGAECVAAELVAGGAVAGAAWLALRRGTGAPAPLAMAAAAAAGALAGGAALQLTCEAGASALHAVVFHAGGIVLAATIAAAVWRRPRLAPEAAA
jgi:hypothetical protein